MFIDFGNGKCPICGDFGKQTDDVVHCTRCRTTFDGFWLFAQDLEDTMKDWT